MLVCQNLTQPSSFTRAWTCPNHHTQHRLRWFGHVQRRPPEAPVHNGVLERVDSVKRGRGRPKLTWDESVTPLRTGASRGLRWTCPNHLSRCWVSFSSIDATPTLSRITSFRTLSLLGCPQNHRNIRISATLSCCTCRLFVGQYSAPYNIAGRIVVL